MLTTAEVLLVIIANIGLQGNKIMDDMSSAMLPTISDPYIQKYLENTSVQMKSILSLWLELMKTMKSAGYQNDESCIKFKENTAALNKEINLLVTDPPVPGCGIKHSKQLKSHLLFDGEIHDFLLSWRTLGGVDEQNIESIHPQFNQLLRKFGNTRGGFRQQCMLNEFVFAHSSWMTNTIDEIINKTKRSKNKKRKRNLTGPGNNLNEAVSQTSDVAIAMIAAVPGAKSDPALGGEEGVAEEDGVVGGVGGADGVAMMRSDGREEDERDGYSATAALTDLEREINGSTVFHGFGSLDTRVGVCAICKQRLLQFAMKVHCHEIHEVHAEVDVEEGRA